MAFPKYDKRNVTQGARPGKSSTLMAKGVTRPPADPTGRMVITHAPKAATQEVHWLPTTGVEWECPHCSGTFRRDEDRKGVAWRAI